MALIKCKLGEHIELCESINSDLKYGLESVRGVNNLKQFMLTKADINARDLAKFQIVYPGEFVFNRRTNRHGSRLCIAYNDGCDPVICTEDYVIFRIKEKSKNLLIAEWLFMFFNRSEFDRYVITNSWGSSTEFFRWEDICNVNIELPLQRVQQKYVDAYKTMIANQQSYERGLEDLKSSIDALLDKAKHSSRMRPVGELLREVDNRNENNEITSVQGINIMKQFMPSVADTNGVNLSNYKVVRNGQFAYSGMQTGRDECIRIALYRESEPIIISPAYSVFEVKDADVLSEYIMVWFSRAESDRRGWFMSDASIRTNLDLDRFFEIIIPVPEMDMQKAIVALYSAYVSRKDIGETLKAQIKDICPILIKGSLEEGRSS